MITSNVKYIMKTKEITIHKLMKLAKVSDHSVLKARTTKINSCSMKTLEKIAKALKCKVKELFEEE